MASVLCRERQHKGEMCASVRRAGARQKRVEADLDDVRGEACQRDDSARERDELRGDGRPEQPREVRRKEQDAALDERQDLAVRPVELDERVARVGDHAHLALGQLGAAGARRRDGDAGDVRRGQDVAQVDARDVLRGSVSVSMRSVCASPRGRYGVVAEAHHRLRELRRTGDELVEPGVALVVVVSHKVAEHLRGHTERERRRDTPVSRSGWRRASCSHASAAGTRGRSPSSRRPPRCRATSAATRRSPVPLTHMRRVDGGRWDTVEWQTMGGANNEKSSTRGGRERKKANGDANGGAQ